MTLIEIAKQNKVISEIKTIAEKEKVSVDFVISGLISGTIVIPKNAGRKIKKLVGIGKGLSTKVNANIGTSPNHISLECEKNKLNSAIEAGADTVMDLSTGGNLKEIRRMVLDNCPVPVGSVPIYQAICDTVTSGKDVSMMEPNHLFDVLEEQLQDGIDFITVHCGVTKESVGILKRQKRVAGIVSRGGAFLARWITANNKENPLYEQFDRLLSIAKKYDVTLSLGDGLRPGCLADASDGAQIAELSILGELVIRAREQGIQAMVEGPGHMPLDQIQPHVQLAKRLTHNAPLYLLGPLVTDVAAGYDHITGAIGGAIAASSGADFLCYLTPAEHLHLPSVNDVYEGVIAARIAAHSADIVKDVKGARKWDNDFSKYRKSLDWVKQQELAFDPIKFKKERENISSEGSDVCTMCGKYCALKQEDNNK